LEKHNFNYLTFSVDREGEGVIPRFTLYSSDLEQMPSPGHLESSLDEEADSFRVQVPQGPFEVVDFRNGKKNTLEQLPDGRLSLKDENGKGIWTIPHTGQICGSVSQIDYLKNNKLQMLFASGTKLYLLTRLGGHVKPYPVETGKDILSGPSVFDFHSDKEYVLAVLHSDNSVVFYDRNGKVSSEFHSISLKETITGIPEPLIMGQAILWTVRTPRQTLIMNAEGLPVANFSRKRRLAPDSKTEVRSQDELEVTCMDGKSYLLNVTTGEFNKL